LKRDKLIRYGFNGDGISRRAEIVLKHNHNHRILNAESLKDNKLLPSAVRNLNKLFQAGHSPMQAKKLIHQDLKEKAAASSSPSTMYIYGQFNKN
jgi:hypothetical protein